MCDLCRSDRSLHPLASGQLDLDLRSQTDRRLPHRLRSRPLLLSTSPAQSPHRTNRSRPPPRSRIRSLISPSPPSTTQVHALNQPLSSATSPSTITSA